MSTRTNYLVLNNKASTNSNLVKINGDIAQPYAQVTVLDASYGDSNLLDLCRAGIDSVSGKYTEVDPGKPGIPTYYRALIDTGPDNAQLANILRVLKTYGQPCLPNSTSPANPFQPLGYDAAALNMFQLSHIDDDHCGQAVQLISAIPGDPALQKSFVNTPVLYHEFPELNPPLVVRPTTGYILPPKGPSSIECVTAPKWLEIMTKANYRLRYEWFYQPLKNATDVPNDPDWTEMSTSASTSNTFPVKILLGDIVKTVSATPPGFVAFFCQVSLEHYGKIGVSMGWETVYAQRQTAPKVGKKRRTTEEVQVMWQSDPFVYQFKVQTPKKLTDNVLVTLINGKAAPATPVLRGTRIFLNLKDKIADLFKTWQALPKPKAAQPWLNPVVPLAMQGKYNEKASKEWDASVVGPTPELYWELLEEVMWGRYAKADTEIDTSTNQGIDIGPFELSDSPETHADDIANRASIITMFRRFNLDAFGNRTTKAFDMLFTGDAYDRNCTIQNTVQAFNSTVPPIQFVDVLKVPHHCSKNTSDAHFYSVFRAQVYLICAAQKKHGNPALLTLEAIAAGFRQSLASYTTGPKVPKLMFFSDPDSLKDVTGSGVTNPSNVWTLLNKSPYRPNTSTTPGPRDIFNYRCFKLRQAPPKSKTSLPDNKSAGRIIFGSSNISGGGLAVQFTVTANEAVFTDYNQNDWVEMIGTP